MYMHVALVHLEKTLIFYYRVLHYTLHSRQRKDWTLRQFVLNIPNGLNILLFKFLKIIFKQQTDM